MARRDRTLYRDTEDQKIAGVCSGLARYFDVDPVLMRVGFVAALVFGGGSLVAYALLWWLVDPAPTGTWADEAEANVPTPTTTTADAAGPVGEDDAAPLAPPSADDEAG